MKKIAVVLGALLFLSISANIFFTTSRFSARQSSFDGSISVKRVQAAGYSNEGGYLLATYRDEQLAELTAFMYGETFKAITGYSFSDGVVLIAKEKIYYVGSLTFHPEADSSWGIDEKLPPVKKIEYEKYVLTSNELFLIEEDGATTLRSQEEKEEAENLLNSFLSLLQPESEQNLYTPHSSKQEESTYASTLELIVDSDDFEIPEIDFDTDTNLDSWVGRYVHYEGVPQQIDAVYDLNIHRYISTGWYYAEFCVAGRMIGFYTLAMIEGNAEEIAVIFYDYMPSGDGLFWSDIKRGDLLFKLKKTESGLETELGEAFTLYNEDGLVFVREEAQAEN